MTTPTKDKTQPKTRPLVDPVSTFIKKTYELLEDQKFVDIVDWNEEGNAIIIKKPLEFSQKVLPTYFKHNNITSFVRQLNMYNFHKRRTHHYDHVYYHDLFKRGKEQMLREIKRKNQDNTLAHIQKAIENLESMQSGQKNETNVSTYENQLLKKLNKDAFGRISSLENKVKDLTIQNQALWNQIAHQNQKEDLLVSFLANFMRTKGISLDQLPKVFNDQFNLPFLKTDTESFKEIPNNNQNYFTGLFNPNCNVGGFLNFGDDSCNSTEVSHSSPLVKNQNNNEWRLQVPENLLENETPELKYPQQSSDSSLKDNSNYTSQGLIPEPYSKQADWSLESNYFNTVAKVDNKVQQAFLQKRASDDSGLLGKRVIDFENESFQEFDKCQKKEMLRNPFTSIPGKMGDESEDSLKLNKPEYFRDAFVGIEGFSLPNFDLTYFN